MTPNDTLTPEDFDELDAVLDDLRNRYDETPQWEFCEGFMAALICCRRSIAPSEYFPVLLDVDASQDGSAASEGSFADAAQAQRFMELWTRRWSEVVDALDCGVETLDDERAYHPEIMDVRGAVAAMPEADRAAMADKIRPKP